MANMQAAIEKILEAHNLLADYQASGEFYVKFTQPSFDPLVIERHGEQVVVGHYFIQNGDVMADPEIVFDYATWTPLELTQHPMGVYRSKFHYRDGVQYVDTRFDAAVRPLVQLWANNLVHQGWTTAAIERNE
jgi:hypothetical protein